jgi:uncharacterized membrane protein YsdA (DUF1294 family)
MMQKDYVKEKLALLKMIMTGIIGAMFAISVYNVQTSGSNFIIVMAATIIILILLVSFVKESVLPN